MQISRRHIKLRRNHYRKNHHCEQQAFTWNFKSCKAIAGQQTAQGLKDRRRRHDCQCNPQALRIFHHLPGQRKIVQRKGFRQQYNRTVIHISGAHQAFGQQLQHRIKNHKAKADQYNRPQYRPNPSGSLIVQCLFSTIPINCKPFSVICHNKTPFWKSNRPPQSESPIQSENKSMPAHCRIQI